MNRALDRLDSFCYPVSPFWVGHFLVVVAIYSKNLDSFFFFINFCFVLQSRETNGSDQPGSNSSWSDEVGITECFEDTAVFYGIAIFFWFFAAMRFMCGRDNKPGIPFNCLNVLKSVSIVIFFTIRLL